MPPYSSSSSSEDSSSSSSSDSDDDSKVQEILEAWKQELQISDDHLKYLENEVEEALDQPLESLREKHLQEIYAEVVNAEYSLLKRIGKGAFGSVFAGKRKADGKIVAIKIIDLEDTNDDIGVINREILALVNGKSCPQLINYYGSNVFGSKLWIVMEYVDGGSIYDKLVKYGRLKEDDIAIIIREVLLGLEFLGQEGRIHRDIKSANILMATNGQVKLADFGATGQLTDTKKCFFTQIGSPYWMAPEIFLEDGGYGPEADVWSLGITCIEMFVGHTPHHNVHPVRVINIIANTDPPTIASTAAEGGEELGAKIAAEASEEMNNFIAACLKLVPQERLNVHELLRHPFIKKAGKVHQLQHL